MSHNLKSTFDLEPNPFEKSFAPDEASSTRSGSLNGLNRHNLKIPNIQSLNNQAINHNKRPVITPTGFTPNDRKLPPLGFLPGAASNPDTPGGSNLWNSLLTATNSSNISKHTGGHLPNGIDQQQQSHHLNQFNLFVSTLRKTGYTPSELNMKTGFTPGGNNTGFPFLLLPGLNTPGALMNSPMTPGLLSLLGITSNLNGQPGGAGLPQQPTIVEKVSNEEETTTNDSNIPPQHPHPHPQLQQTYQQALNINTGANPGAVPAPASVPVETSSEPALVVKEKVEIKEEPVKKRKAGANSGTKKRKTENNAKKEDNKKLAAVKDELKDKDNEINLDKDESGDTTEKRKVFLERNRIAASKCRQRKKQLIQKMEDELAFYSSGYREVSARMAQLRSQLITLLDILMAHKDCSTLLPLFGGLDNFNNLMQQTAYLTQISDSTVANPLSMPSTIPTTLNNLIPQLQLQLQLTLRADNEGRLPNNNQAIPTELQVPPGANPNQPHIQGQTRGQVPGHQMGASHGQLPVQMPIQNQLPIQPLAQQMGQQLQLSHQQIHREGTLSQDQANGTNAGANSNSNNRNNSIPTSANIATNAASNAANTIGSANNTDSSSNNQLDLRSANSMTNIAELRNNVDTGFSLRPVSSMANLQLHNRPVQESYGLNEGNLLDPNGNVLHLHN